MKQINAIITGASTGIGQAIAIALAKQCSYIALVGRNHTGLLKTKRYIKNAGGKADIYICDFTNKKSLKSFISEIRYKLHSIDILVNAAGIWHNKHEAFAGKMLSKFSEKVIRDMYSVGITTPTLLAHAFIPLMPKGAKILNISGTFENGAKGWLPYYVSKRAIEDFTAGLAQDLKDKNIQVNAISPSDTATDAYKKYFPQYIESAIDPNDIGKYASFLCSSKVDTITGKVYVMKKGKKPYEEFHA